MFSKFIRYSLPALLLGLAACSASTQPDDDVLAVNELTGEQKTFPDSGSVPPDWTVCENNVCPTLTGCGELGEAQCLARNDCQAFYIGAWPQECEGESPPSYCAQLPFGGCGPANPPGGGGGTTPPGGGGGTVPPGGGGGSTPPGGGGTTPPGGGCGPLPACEALCAPGYTHPIDENGCEHTCECVPEPTCDCGPQPQLAMICDDGSTADMLCEKDGEGTCNWTFRCTTCQPSDCGPAPQLAMMCNDGSTADMVCAAASGNTANGCGWTFVCP